MPIKPENRKLYPDNWNDISKNIRKRARNRCEICGLKNNAIIKRLPDGFTRQPTPHEWAIIKAKMKFGHKHFLQALKDMGFIKIVLTVAHLDQNPQNNKPENLKALCQKCHLNIDRKYNSERRKNAGLKNQLKLNLTVRQPADTNQ